MRIPLYHLHGLVPGDGGDLQGAKGFLSEALALTRVNPLLLT
ncbi:hypothetical protein [Acidiferrobacter sp.]|nr:hypothetical protein [Acidiferrobacter sp.]